MTLFMSLTMGACLPIDHALEFLGYVSHSARAHRQPTIIPIVADASVEGPIWIAESLYTYHNLGPPPVCATNGQVAVEGIRDPFNVAGVFVYDAESGEQVWATAGPGYWHVACARDAIFIAEGSSVTRREPRTGRTSWRVTVPWPGNIIHLHYLNGRVYLWTRPQNATTILEAETGERIPTPPANRGCEILLSEDDTAYALLLRLMLFRHGQTEPSWVDPLDDAIFEPPSFGASEVYVRTGRSIGAVYALAQATGEVLWASDHLARSNLLLADGSLFLLTQTGELFSLNPSTGESTLLLSSQPADLPFGGDDGGYYLAYSSQPSRLFLYLGATRQLLAFELGP